MKSVAVDTSSVALVEHPLEQQEHFAGGETLAAQAPSIDDEALRDLAKRRLATKRSLIGQAIDFPLIAFFLLLAAAWNYYEAMGVVAIFCVFWGLRLAYRVFKFMQPSFKEGFAAYLHKRKEQQLENEYSRLKKMSADYVAHEMNQ